MNTLSHETITHILGEIKSARLVLDRQYVATTAEEIARFENRLTLDEIEACLATYPCVDLEEKLCKLFANRWEKIRNSNMCYTHSPYNIVNRLSLDVAKALYPIPATEEEIDALPAGQGPYFILMPSLTVSADAYGSNIHQLTLHQFILSDDERLYIPIESCLERAFISDTGVLGHMVSEGADFPLLSATETARLTHHSILVEDYYQAIVAYNQQRIHGGGLGAQLQRLRNSLVAGGSHQGGREFDSGHAANIGIVEFYKYWDSLSEAEKQELNRKYYGLSEVTGRLLRPTDADYTSVRYCVELIADRIDSLITSYALGTQSLTDLQHIAELHKQRFVSAMHTSFYAMLPSTARPPKVLALIYQLDTDEQKAIFANEGSKDAWMYALEHAPASLTEFSGLLNERAIQDAIQAKFTFNQGMSPLMIAVKAGCSDAVSMLLDFEVDIDAQDDFNNTALIWAALHGHRGIFDALLARGANMKLRSFSTTKNVLDVAIEGHPELVEPLLMRAVTSLDAAEQEELLSNVSGSIYKSVLSYAAAFSQPLIVPLLTKIVEMNDPAVFKMNHTVQISGASRSVTTLTVAALLGNNDTLQGLLDKTALDAEEQTNRNNALIWSANQGKLDAVNTLLDNGAQIEAKGNLGNTSLLWAVLTSRRFVVEALLLRHANINARNDEGKNAVDIAIASQPELLELLLMNAVTLAATDQEELLRNVSGGIYKSVLAYVADKKPHLIAPMLRKMIEQNDTAMLKARFTTHIRSEVREVTPLALASLSCDNELLRSFIRVMGENVSELNTALLFAACEGKLDAVNILLESGAQVEAKCSKGHTPIIWAALNGHSDIIAALLARDADITAVDEHGNNVLDIAELHHPELFALLLDKALTLDLKNKQGKNVMDIVLQSHPVLLESLLLKAATFDAEKQEELLHNVSNGSYKSILTFTMLEKPECLYRVMRLIIASSPSDDLENVKNYMHGIDFLNHLQGIRVKWQEMEKKAAVNPNYLEAAKVAKKLTFQLAEEATLLFQTDSPFDNVKKAGFQGACVKHMNDAMFVLEQHRGWKRVLTALLIVLTFPITLPLYAAGFFSMQTDSARKLREFEHSLVSDTSESRALPA